MSYNLTSAVYAVFIAFFASIVLSPLFIPFLHKLKFGQPVRDDGPKTHLKKTGTPTMGGIIIVISLLISSLFFIKNNTEGLLAVFMTIGFGLIGFMDDFAKVVQKNPKGLKAYQKTLAGMIIAGIFIFLTYKFNIDTRVYVPFSDGKFIDFVWFTPLFLLFVILGTVNGVNFTDGLDGLNSGVTVLVSTFFLFIACAVKSPVVPIIGAVVGSLLGFLLFNAHPARIFMGDTGSLALGGFIAAIAVMLKMPLILVIVGFIYVAEVMSVILQIGYFKLTKGKRLFKMAPIHHHFEVLGWQETKVVALFYIATSILCLVGYLATNGYFFK